MKSPNTDSISIRSILLEFAYTPMGETETPDTSKAEAKLLQLLESKAEIFPEKGIGSLEPVRAIRVSALNELRSK